MPVMYVAVGRRLGYPLKLVQTRGHLFARWDDPDGKCFGFPETFNVEGAGEGIASYDDEHYKTWPEPWTEIDEAEGWYLKSMTPLRGAGIVSGNPRRLLDRQRSTGRSVQKLMHGPAQSLRATNVTSKSSRARIRDAWRSTNKRSRS